jgi:hypothetical protein
MDAIFPKADMPFQIAESISYDPRAQDLSAEVTKMRGINPDLVMVVTRAGDAIKLVRDMVRQRFEPKAIISPGSPGLSLRPLPRPGSIASLNLPIASLSHHAQPARRAGGQDPRRRRGGR